MNKISEKVDLSKKILDIDINSEALNALKADMNQAITNVIRQVYDEKFESGEVTVKLNIEILTAYEKYAGVNEIGEKTQEEYKYRKPVIEHKISTVLKKQYKAEGIFDEKRDIQYVGGRFVAVPIKEAQTSLFDSEEDY